jgi:TolA-binding protein
MLFTRRARRFFALICVTALPWLALRGADSADQTAFNAALRSFMTGSFGRAVTEFGEFTNRFPNSPLSAEAGRRALFASGEEASARNDHATAEKIFAAYQAAFAESDLALDAAVRQADAALKSGDARKAVDVLGQENGPFLKAKAAGTPKNVLLAGLSLIAEARLVLKETEEAKRAITEATPFATSPEDRWNRLRLQLRILETAGEREPVIAAATELRKLADVPELASRRPESSALLGRLLFEANQPDRAVAALEENLPATVPAGFRADAIERLTDHWIRRGELNRARDQIEAFLTATPDDPGAASLRLRLGQVLFRQFQVLKGTNAPSPEAATLLVRASTELDRAATNTTRPEILGPIALDRGWCWWEDALIAKSRQSMTGALLSFSNAAVLLPPSTAQFVAKFKAADAAAWLGNQGAALAGYLEIAESATNNPAVRDELVPQALEQAVIAAVASSNAPAGERALRQLLTLPKAAQGASRSALLLGTTLARQGSGDLGRELLRGFLEKFPQTEARSDIELEMATLALHEERWTNAVQDLRSWIAANTNHAGSARAGFHLAYALARAGEPAAAMDQFATMAAKYPNDPGAITAQLWLAGHFFGQQDYLRAGQASAAILTNAAVKAAHGEVWYRAKLWAAEAGRKLQNFDSAGEQFRELLKDKAAPPDIQAAAYFHYGEMLLEKPAASGADPLSGFRLALEAFSRVPEFTNSPYVTPALGMMANCHFQLGAVSPANYERAAELYQRAAKTAGAGIESRSHAWLGYAEVTRKIAELKNGVEAGELLDRAINTYQDVALGKILKPGEKLPQDALVEAVRSAGEMLERLGRSREAAGLYQHAARELPSAAAAWNDRARRALETVDVRPL